MRGRPRRVDLPEKAMRRDVAFNFTHTIASKSGPILRLLVGAPLQRRADASADGHSLTGEQPIASARYGSHRDYMLQTAA
jgi:hypothetical protein